MTDTASGATPNESVPTPDATTSPETPAPAAAQHATAPTEPLLPAAETAVPAAEAPTAPAAPAAQPVQPAAPAVPAAQPAAPAPQSAPAAPAAQPAAPAPVAPVAPVATGTVYHPGQPPQPYHAPAYGHVAPQQPAPSYAGGGVVPPAFGGPAVAGAPGAGPAPKKRRVGFGIAAGIVAAALIGGGAGAGITAAINSTKATSTVAGVQSPQNVVVNDTSSVNQITAAAAKAAPSVVTIQVASQSGAGTGSGVVLSDDGYVVTNTHVVTLDGETGSPTIQVQTSDGRLYQAELVGTDPTTDLAVIKLQGASGLTPLEFADSDDLNVGDLTVAIGAPLGLANTVTNGIVSALNRSIAIASSAAPESGQGDGSDGSQGERTPFDFWNNQEGGGQQQLPQQSSGSADISLPVIQTDASINPGNSGGALLGADGKLIGVNVAILDSGASQGQAGSIGLGFAIPSNVVKRIANELIEHGAATHGLLGASVGDAASQDGATTTGAFVSEVTKGGAGEAAGLRAGDVVTGFGSVPISDATDLTAQVRASAAGSKQTLTVVRDGKTLTFDVTLGTFQG